MKLNISKEWITRMAELEDGCSVTAGCSRSMPRFMSIRRQPEWPDNEPEYITNIEGGFVDGYGNRFHAPIGDFYRVDAMKLLTGEWEWLVYERYNGISDKS